MVEACTQAAVVVDPFKDAVPAFRHAKLEIVPPLTTIPSESASVTVLVALNANLAPAFTIPVAAEEPLNTNPL